jgi:hypothetical protein
MTEIFFNQWTHQFEVRALPAVNEEILNQIETLRASKDADVTSLHTKIDTNFINQMGLITNISASVTSLESMTTGFSADIAQLQAAVLALQ